MDALLLIPPPHLHPHQRPYHQLYCSLQCPESDKNRWIGRLNETEKKHLAVLYLCNTNVILKGPREKYFYTCVSVTCAHAL